MLLNCHTYFSLRYGTLSPKELANALIINGYTSFALTDINNTSACIEMVRELKEKKLKPVLGIDFRNGIQQQYVGLALNNEGFYELNRHLSMHLHQKKFFNYQAPNFNHVYIIYPFSSYKGWTLRDNEYIGLSVKDLKSLAFLSLRNRHKKMVMMQTTSFTKKWHFNAHRLLRAIDKNTLISKLLVEEQCSPDEMIIPINDLLLQFSAYPDIVQNTFQLLDSCDIVDFVYKKFGNKNRQYFTTSLEGDIEKLRQECKQGIEYRYGSVVSEEVILRMEKELDVISMMKFASYFLINWDITQYAQHKGYYYVGRGSGANSMLAYLLRITDVDPIKLDLYFERFINEYRTTPPDFDIDFSWTDRDDITRYIFDTYGHEHTALLGTYNTFQHDAVTNELGKVFGLSAGEIDKLQRTGKYDDNEGKLILQYGAAIHGFPSNLSIHSSGIIISEKPIHYYTGTFMPPKGYPTTQFSMIEAEDIGLYKFDILSQRGLGKIKDALQLIKENKNDEIDIHAVEKFYRDERIKSLLSVGKTIGCFYVESPAMRMLLTKLRADDYLRLVAASSIIRPGVAKSGMMREYIVRFQNQNARDSAKKEMPELYELLKETYGVMVYQEDVIKVAHFFAGLSLADADYLRRGMSWKFKQRNEFHMVQKKFFDNCLAKGHRLEIISKIWTQIETFANFAFSKGHSASYAVESYQALYLKAYYPLEYMVATLNNGGGFYRRELYVHEARLHGGEIIAPCVNNSNELGNIKGKTIFLGLSFITSLEQEVQIRIVEERKQNGLFNDLYDFVKRVPIGIEQLRLLIRANAFAFTRKTKKELLWEIHTITNNHKSKVKEAELFDIRPKKWELPTLDHHRLDDTYDELELLGFALCSPFDLLEKHAESELIASNLKNYIGKTVSIIGYMITVKSTGTSKGEKMYFGTFIDRVGQWIDTVHFPQSAKQYPFTGPGCYKLTGKVTVEFDFLTLEVNEMQRINYIDRDKKYGKATTAV